MCIFSHTYYCYKPLPLCWTFEVLWSWGFLGVFSLSPPVSFFIFADFHLLDVFKFITFIRSFFTHSPVSAKRLRGPQLSGWGTRTRCCVCSLSAPSAAFALWRPFSCPVTLALPRILCGSCVAALLPFVPAFWWWWFVPKIGKSFAKMFGPSLP